MPKAFEKIVLQSCAALLAVLPAAAGACAPEILAMQVPNPATGANAAGAMPAYEVPPFREDHRYEVTLAEWTPASLAFHVPFRERRPLWPAVELLTGPRRRQWTALPLSSDSVDSSDDRYRSSGRDTARLSDRWIVPGSNRRQYALRDPPDSTDDRPGL
jgi:hypothetical protein